MDGDLERGNLEDFSAQRPKGQTFDAQRSKNDWFSALRIFPSPVSRCWAEGE